MTDEWTDEFNLKEDTEKFLRRVELKAHFHDKDESSDRLQRDASLKRRSLIGHHRTPNLLPSTSLSRNAV